MSKGSWKQLERGNYVISFHCVEKSCTTGLQSLRRRVPEYLQKASEVPRLKTLEGF